MPEAQYNLAILYTEGAGVPRNLVKAYTWFSVALASGHADAGAARDTISGRMTSDEIGVAAHLAQIWKPATD